jgi:hypothetical protein
LVHFLVLGGLLFGFQTLWSRASETPVVEVRRSDIEAQIEAYRQQMGRPPDERVAAAIERQVIDNAVWLEQAWALGLHEVDPVVRQRLILNMRFLEGESDATDERLFQRALELGMERSDPVVQRRLIDRVQAIVRAGVRARPIDEAELAAHYEATTERWREPPLLDLTHVYLSRDKRGEDTAEDARRLIEKLRREQIAPEDAPALGDPFLSGHRLRGATPPRIVSRLGPEFEAGVRDAPIQTWVGPIESAFGAHAVWIHARQPSRLPPLEEIRERVVEDWIEAESREALREHVARLRKTVEIRIVDDGRRGAAHAAVDRSQSSLRSAREGL